MNENKRIYDKLQKHGVSAKLISRLLILSGKQPRVAKSYEPKTIYSIIHNNVEDKAVNDTLIFLENLCNNGMPKDN